jgi:hypothetical protein
MGMVETTRFKIKMKKIRRNSMVQIKSNSSEARVIDICLIQAAFSSSCVFLQISIKSSVGAVGLLLNLRQEQWTLTVGRTRLVSGFLLPFALLWPFSDPFLFSLALWPFDVLTLLTFSRIHTHSQTIAAPTTNNKMESNNLIHYPRFPDSNDWTTECVENENVKPTSYIQSCKALLLKQGSSLKRIFVKPPRSKGWA